ncbi:diguanylate phosphodiesterase [Acinetobacter pittii]|jgi:EAL domain-containing protein (putative c-di-GMP-specific phosphodiesterase class I)/PAS domain-containing protein|nr:EAL domain-containing protein [Acinetobacter pittii]CDH41553.1 two-component system, PleD related family,response regulator [Acinetobacter pittii 42F]KQD32138.1 diguanylate phosphodiesterase [Acinetobacter pittii]KQD48360.1 diguanylate phosphodiesterase [Acinetobacter pittii]KQE62836.1 diguanylate phosphodiesterase [Acinetobacter pittii]KQE74517.1 diguanylate phosphodiesterase [Acinetobacter pittii]
MGSTKVRNSLLSKKLKRTETRLLIIDDNQLRYNQILNLLLGNDYQVQALLLDDLKSFEKQLNTPWDAIIFGRAYDLKIEQTLSLIQASEQPNLPVLLLQPDDYQPQQYQAYIQKGIYDVVPLEPLDYFYITLIRTLSYSHLLQTEQRLTNELETIHSHTQTLVNSSHKAVALFQEGMHVKANTEYLNLFGFKQEDEIIGLPILDVLQPDDLNVFKQRFKKISLGQFDQARFEIQSQHAAIAGNNALKLEFIPSQEEDAVQLTIDYQLDLATPANTLFSEKSYGVQAPWQQINRQLSTYRAQANALILFKLNQCPERVFQQDWQTPAQYFNQLHSFLKEHAQMPIFNIELGAYVGVLQAENSTVLNSQLTSLQSLQKEHLLKINELNYSIQFKLSYAPITESLNEDSFTSLLDQTNQQELPKAQAEIELAPTIDIISPEPVKPSISLDLSLEQVDAPLQSSLLQQLKQQLARSEIHLKYQQIYDKHDQETHNYEVTSGFISDEQWHDINDLAELREDSELSIQLDRWILVEACKQLHNFITQYPKAKLIINLNIDILLKDKSFPELISKLLTIIGSKLESPLVLQFSEQAIQPHLAIAQQHIAHLRQHGAEISIRDFSSSMYSESILQQLDVQYLKLQSKKTELLNSDDGLVRLQEKVLNYLAVKPVGILLSELNDMNSFANAWNVETRFLQGQYFQKKLDRLTDVQDQ